MNLTPEQLRNSAKHHGGIGKEATEWCADRIEELERQVAQANSEAAKSHRFLDEALNSGDGTYRP